MELTKEILLKDNNNVEYFDQIFKEKRCPDVIQGKIFEDCQFDHCNFNNSSLLDCKFVDCDFTYCNFNNAILTNSSFSNVNFDNSRLMEINWNQAKWPRLKLFGYINFFSCNINYSSFFSLYLSEIKLQKCIARYVDFREANLSHSDLSNTDFHNSLFINTDLSYADFSDAINYNIDVTLNNVKKAIFSFPDVINLIKNLDIEVKGLDEEFCSED